MYTSKLTKKQHIMKHKPIGYIGPFCMLRNRPVHAYGPPYSMCKKTDLRAPHIVRMSRN